MVSNANAQTKLTTNIIQTDVPIPFHANIGFTGCCSLLQIFNSVTYNKLHEFLVTKIKS